MDVGLCIPGQWVISCADYSTAVCKKIVMCSATGSPQSTLYSSPTGEALTAVRRSGGGVDTTRTHDLLFSYEFNL